MLLALKLKDSPVLESHKVNRSGALVLFQIVPLTGINMEHEINIFGSLPADEMSMKSLLSANKVLSRCSMTEGRRRAFNKPARR